MGKIVVYGSHSFVSTIRQKHPTSTIIPFFEPNSFFNSLYAFENQDIEVIMDENSIQEKKGIFDFLGFNKNKLLKSDIQKHPVLVELSPTETKPKPVEVEEDFEEPEEEGDDDFEEPEEEGDDDFDLEALIAGGAGALEEPEEEGDDDFDLEALIAGGAGALGEPEEEGDDDFDLEALISNAEQGNLPTDSGIEENSLEEDLQNEIEESMLSEETLPPTDEDFDLDSLIDNEEIIEEESEKLVETLNSVSDNTDNPPSSNINNEELKKIIETSIKETLVENTTQNIHADLSTINSILKHMLDNKDIYVKISLRKEEEVNVIDTSTPTVLPTVDFDFDPLAEQGSGLAGQEQEDVHPEKTQSFPEEQPKIEDQLTNLLLPNFDIDPLAEQGSGLAGQEQEDEYSNYDDTEKTAVNYEDFDLDAFEKEQKKKEQEQLMNSMISGKPSKQKKKNQPDLVGNNGGNNKPSKQKKKSQPDLVGNNGGNNKSSKQKKKSQPDLVGKKSGRKNKSSNSNDSLVSSDDVNNMSDDDLFAMMNGNSSVPKSRKNPTPKEKPTLVSSADVNNMSDDDLFAMMNGNSSAPKGRKKPTPKEKTALVSSADVNNMSDDDLFAMMNA
jgi:succinate dehydrogenase flavin-adding protein (antitoxin of CptAB toxin-antitoxin module)